MSEFNPNLKQTPPEVKKEFTTKENSNPTLEDAFVAMIENVDRMQNERM